MATERISTTPIVFYERTIGSDPPTRWHAAEHLCSDIPLTIAKVMHISRLEEAAEGICTRCRHLILARLEEKRAKLAAQSF